MQRSSHRWKLLPLTALFALFFCAATEVQSADGSLGPEATNWIEQVIGDWNRVRRNDLKQSETALPWIVLFDDQCVHHLNPDPEHGALSVTERGSLGRIGRDLRVLSFFHGGAFELPDGERLPAQLATFAGSYNKGRRSFLVASMPAIWRKDPELIKDPQLDLLIRSVFAHEMTHTLHRGFSARLDALERRLKWIDGFDDDVVQKTFQLNSDFVAAYTAEHAQLRAAIADVKRSEKQKTLRRALELIRERRSRFLKDKYAGLADAEEIFLTMEGAANWAAYRVARNNGLDDSSAQKLIRRSGKHWSQDEGLTMFLLLDALDPDWIRNAFGTKPKTVTEMLANALR